nr:FtsX-like permease family protein [uncultured Methanoregula sp.]
MPSSLHVSALLAVRGLQRGNRFTTVLTVLIIAMVFVMLCFQPSFNAGIVAAINNGIIDYSYGNVVIEPRDHEGKPEMYIQDATALRNKVDRIPGVVASTARLRLGATLSYKDNIYTGSVNGIDPSDEMQVLRTHTKLIAGEFLTDADRDQIVIGTLLAGHKDTSLDKVKALRGAAVGDSIDVTYSNGVTRSYRVKGIYQTDNMYADTGALITRKEAESATGLDDKASIIAIRIADPGQDQVFKNTLRENDIQQPVKTWSEEAGSMMTDTAKSFDMINAIFTTFDLLVASIVIFIVVFINTVNKRKQIAIMKAIGIKKEIIINNYLLQVLVLCTLGVILGLCVFLLQADVMTAHPIKFPSMGDIIPQVSAGLVASAILDLFVVSFIAGYIPAWMTTKEEILDAMRG